MRMDPASHSYQTDFLVILEEHPKTELQTVWRYVIQRKDTDEVVVHGWADDLNQAQETAELQLSSICAPDSRKAA